MCKPLSINYHENSLKISFRLLTRFIKVLFFCYFNIDHTDFMFFILPYVIVKKYKG